MARYTGPICRLCRRTGEKLMLKGGKCLTPKCAVERRGKPPGKVAAGRRRISDRAIQLREKQKARYGYGLFERQFRQLFTEAERLPGITGENLLVLLERRLDNIVFRLGFADSRSQARQLVSHGHILLNGRKATIPSRQVGEGDVIGWMGSSEKNEYHKMVAETIKSRTVPNWLTLDRQALTGKVASLPTSADLDLKLSGKSIVEYYSR